MIVCDVLLGREGDIRAWRQLHESVKISDSLIFFQVMISRVRRIARASTEKIEAYLLI